MPKRKEPVMNNAIARDIFNELDLYAKDKQFYPVEHALYAYMTRFVKGEDGTRRRCYNLSISTFRWWFLRLVEEGYIKVDPETRAIRAVHLMIVEREDESFVNGKFDG
jgi:hypothetical protein